jgi:hypothetical protein
MSSTKIGREITKTTSIFTEAGGVASVGREWGRWQEARGRRREQDLALGAHGREGEGRLESGGERAARRWARDLARSAGGAAAVSMGRTQVGSRVGSGLSPGMTRLGFQRASNRQIV